VYCPFLVQTYEARVLAMIFLNNAKKAIRLSKWYYKVMSQKAVKYHNNNMH
jgi:hypothetical protein